MQYVSFDTLMGTQRPEFDEKQALGNSLFLFLFHPMPTRKIDLFGLLK